MQATTRLVRATRLNHLPSSATPAPRRASAALAPRAYEPEPEPQPHQTTFSHRHHVALSLAGLDRVGIFRTFTACAAHANANVEESRMALLGGDFALIARLSLQERADVAALTARLRARLPGFSLSVRHTTAPVSMAARAAGRRSMWRVRLHGPDRPGIVAALAAQIECFGGNVHEMHTETGEGQAGVQFRMDGKVQIDDNKLDALVTALEGVEERFGVSIALGYVEQPMYVGRVV